MTKALKEFLELGSVLKIRPRFSKPSAATLLSEHVPRLSHSSALGPLSLLGPGCGVSGRRPVAAPWWHGRAGRLDTQTKPGPGASQRPVGQRSALHPASCEGAAHACSSGRSGQRHLTAEWTSGSLKTLVLKNAGRQWDSVFSLPARPRAVSSWKHHGSHWTS